MTQVICERLEGRQLLASVSGTVWNDVNRDGIKGGGESGQSGRTVYVDTNNNGVLDAGESQTITGATGNYVFNNITAGQTTYIRLLQQLGWSQTFPASAGPNLVTGSASSVNFGVVNRSTVVTGLVWNDRNASGIQDAVEPALAGRTVYVDSNNNGVLDAGEPNGVSGPSGSWAISDVLPGSRVIRLETTGDQIVTYPAGTGGATTVNVAPGVITSNVAFGQAVTYQTGFSALQRLPNPSATATSSAWSGSIAISGNYAVVGAPTYVYSGSGNGPVGRADILSNTGPGGSWVQVQNLQPGTLGNNSDYGSSVSIDGDWAAIAADGESNGFGNAAGSVYLFKRTGNTWSKTQKLSPPDYSVGQFGLSVLLHGTELFLGVALTSGAGLLLQYRLSSDGTTWTNTGQLQASDPTTNQRFGSDSNISISGGTMVVGARGGNGAAYVFVRGDTGNWSFAQKLTASTPEPGSRFGGSVSVEGDLMAIGASLSTDPAGSGGKVYIFKRDSAGIWQQDTTLTTTDTGSGNQFGATVRLSGRSLFVGVPRADTLATDAGRLYVFRLTTQGTWSLYVASSESSVFDSSLFGSSLAGLPDLLLVGAPLSGGSGNRIGAVSFYSAQNSLTGYILGTVFTDTNRNASLDASESGLSGRVVYLDTNSNGVLDGGEPATVTDSSGRYAFGPLAPGAYTVRTTIDTSIESQTAPGGDLSYNITLGAGQTYAGDFGIVNQPTVVSGLVWNDRNLNGAIEAGEPLLSGQTVYVDLNGNGLPDPGELRTTTGVDGRWALTGVASGVQTVRIAADDKYMVAGSGAWTGALTAGATTSGLTFGLAVKVVTGFGSGQLVIAGTGAGNTQVTDLAISGDNAILGAASFSTSGAAFILRRGADGNWTNVQTLQPGFLSTTSRMGSKVSMDGDWAAVSAPNFYGVAPDTQTARYGTVLLYRRQVDGTWSLAQTISSPATAFNGYGQNILLKGSELLIQSSNSFLDYQLNTNGTWTAAGSLPVIAAGTDPKPISMGNGVLVVGNPANSDQAAYVYTRSASGAWLFSQRLAAPAAGQQYGASVATDGRHIAIGAPQTQGYSEGQVYTYSLSGATWQLDAKLTIPQRVLNGGFGYNVQLENNALYVAAPFAQFATGYGAIYVYIPGPASSGWLLESVLDPSVGPATYTAAALLSVSGSDIILSSAGPAPGNASIYPQVSQPASYLKGIVFNDANQNGVQDAGEAGRSGWTVYIDLDNNGRLDTGEPSTVSDTNGAYAFDDLAPGKDYVVRIVQQAGKSQTYPTAGNGFVVTSLAPGSVVSASFGVTNGGTTVTGVVWNDRNADGLFDTNETVVGGPIVYWDGNNNGRLDIGELSTTAAADGTWTILDVPPGQQSFSVSPASGYVATTSAVSVTVLPATVKSGVNLGVAIQVVGGTTLAQTLDMTATDSIEQFGQQVVLNGNYSFVSAPDSGALGPLTGHTYVYQKDPTGSWTQTQTLELSADPNLGYISGFGSAVASDGNWTAVGTYYYDQPGDPSVGPQGVILLYDTASGSPWTYRQTLIGGGPAFVPGRLESVLIRGSLLFAHVSSSSQSSIETYRLGSNGVWSWASEVILQPTGHVGSRSLSTMSLSGDTLVVSDGTTGVGLAKVYSVDLSGNLNLRTALNAPYQLTSGSFLSSVSIEGNTIAVGVVPNTFTVASAVFTYSRQSNGSWTYSGSIAPGGPTNDSFGAAVLLSGPTLYVGAPDTVVGTNMGTVFAYTLDRTGGWKLETSLSPDISGSWVNYGASIASSGSDLVVSAPGSATQPYTLGGTVYFYQRPLTAVAYVQGRAYEDSNSNGVFDQGEPPLVGWKVFLDTNGNGQPDPGEPQATTDIAGLYAFDNPAIGSYTLRIVGQDRWTQTAPANGGIYTITLAPGETFSGDFGFRRSSVVTGYVFADANHDGARQPAVEPGLVKWVVFADLNGNGVPDTGDPIAVTADDGSYTLRDLPSGQVTIAVVNGAAWEVAPIVVTVAAFTSTTGVNFGSYPASVTPPDPTTTLSFGGRLIIDEDGNGLIDSDENFPVPNAVVNIYRDDGDGLFEPDTNDPLVSSTSSDAAGNVAFPSADAGSYWVAVSTTSTGALVESPAGATVHSLFGRNAVQRVVIGTEQPSVNLDYSVLTAFTVVTNLDKFDSKKLRRGDYSNLSLREALFVSRLQGAAIITFLPSLANTTITLGGLGQLSIGAGVSIFGPDEGPITINAVNTYRAIYVETGSTVFLQNLVVTNASANTGSAITVADNAAVTGTGLTIRNSVATQSGGAVYVNSGGSLSLINSQLYGNSAASAGGAIYADVNSTLNLDRVTLYSNSATGTTGDGGAVYSLGNLSATQVTVANNTARRFGGGLALTGGTASILNATVASNTATGVTSAQTGGAGIYAAGLVRPTLRNSIVAQNTSGDRGPADVSGTLASDSGYVLLGTGGGGLTNGVTGNQLGAPQSPLDPRLMALGVYGGSIPTMPPRTNSPAIDAGLNSFAAAIATDPAGGARIRDFNKDGTSIVDLGAYEARPVITVTSTLDEASDTDGLRSLREAIAYAETGTGLNVIQVSPALLQGDSFTLSLGLGAIDINGVIEIDGPPAVAGQSATKLTLGASQFSRHFNVTPSGWLMLSNLTLSQGSSNGDGGSILNEGHLDVASTLFWNNRALGSGGAVASSGTFTSVNTTFSSNSATGSGGSVYVSGGSTTILNSTLADSVARSQNSGTGSGGNIAVSSGSVSLTNSIITGGRRGTTLGTSAATPSDATGVFTGGTYNFVSVVDGSTGLTGIGSIFGTAPAPADPKLAGLADNTGPTLTYGVLPGSPVVDSGNNTPPTLLGLATDARGLPRFKDGNDDGVIRVDIGAFEQQVPLNQAPTLTTLATLQGAVQDTPFTLRYDTLLAASNANDPENAPIRFIITSLTSGNLTIDGQPYSPGILFGPGQTLVWTPPVINFAGQRSVLAQAFSVEAFDGQVASRSPVPVNLQVVSTAEEVNYAVLFSGGDNIDLNYANYYDNIKRTYQTLVTRYGVLPANIYVIYADGTNPAPDQRGNINSDMSFAANVLPATRDNLRRTLANIGALADANDHFFFWTFDHGLGTPQQPTVTGEEVLRGWGDSETIGAADLRVWLQGLSPGDNATAFGVPTGYTGVRAGYNTDVFGQCFAGGMLAPLKTGTNVLAPGTRVFGAAAANHYEASYADYFIGAYTDALDAGYNNTLDAYNFAYSRDGRAARGEQYAPNAGTWQYNVEHPFALGDSVTPFPIFATPRNANGVPTVVSVTPLKVPSSTTDLTVTYEMLSAAVNAIDPTTQNFAYRISNVGTGSLLTTTGLPIDLNNVAQSTISLGESFVYRRPAGSTGTLNDLVVRVIASDGTPAASWTTLPLRVGGPASGAVAVNDSTTLQFNTLSIPINVLGNDQGSSLRVDRLGVPSHGTVRIDAVTGQVTYTPPTGYIGSDAFSYILKDGAGNTDIGNVSINVVSYDPNARTSGAPNYTMTELGVPPSWAGLPLDNAIGWTAAYRNSIPAWITSSGVDIDDQGRVLVRVFRDTTNYQPGSFVEYVGGTVSTYIWSASSIAPYWNWSVSANATDTNAVLTHYLYTADSNPHAGDGQQHAAVYGLDASSLGTSSLQPARLLYNGDNANSTGQPSFGVLIQNPGQIQNAGTGNGQDVVLGPDNIDLLPVAVSPTEISPGVSLVLANDRASQTAQLWSYDSSSKTWSQQPLRTITGATSSVRAFGEAMLPNGSFVGTDSTTAGTYLAFAYDYTANTSARLTPLAGDTSSAALAVNSSGIAIGVSATSLAFRDAANGDYRVDRAAVRRAGSHAVRWINGVAQSLGTLATDGSGWSVANDINDSGVIVGSSNGQAFIYVGGAMYNLNALITNLAPGTVLVSADSINSLGQIVATESSTVSGQQVTRAVFLDLASSLQLQPDSAVTSAQSPVVIRPLDNDRGASYLTSIDTTGLRGTATLDPLTNTITYNPAGQFNGIPFNQFPITTRLSYTARDAFGAVKSSTITITVNALSTFNVTSFSPTSSGFTLTFNAPPATSQLNLYSGPNNPGRLPDLTLVDNNSSPVPGSFLRDSADGLTWRFVARGGALTAPSYTLTLSSRTDGFTSSTLGLLDGNFDNTPGGDYTKTFSPPDLSAASRQVTLGYIARAAGQALNAPATTAIPLTLVNTSSVRGLSFNLRFDPALLSLTGLTPASTLPGDWSLSSRLVSPGLMSIALSGVTALPNSSFTFATLLGSVPSSATPFAASTVRLTDVVVNEGALPATGDDSVLVAALPGDADASGDYSSNDTNLINRISLGTDSGLDAYPLIDPQVIADVTANGTTTPFDASQVAAVVAGAGSPYLGALPGLSISASTPLSITTATASLSALASYALGESAVTYSWSLFSSSLANPSLSFSVNGSNAARSTVATFGASGSYVLRVSATAPDGRTVATQVQVGVVIQVPSPGSPSLTAASDTGVPGDNLTNLNNSSLPRRLTFTIPNTLTGATVNLYAGSLLIGSTLATGTTTTVVSNGSTPIPDGPTSFTASQVIPSGTESARSAAALVTIDTQAPTVSLVNTPAPLLPDGPASLSLRFSKPVTGLSLSSLTLTRDAGANLLTSAQAPTSADQANWTVPSLTSLTALPGAFRFNLASTGITDLAGNPLPTGLSANWTRNTLTGTSQNDNISINFVTSSSASISVNNAPAFPLSLAALPSLIITAPGGSDTLSITGTSPLGTLPIVLASSLSLTTSTPLPQLTVTGTGTLVTASRLDTTSLFVDTAATLRLTGNTNTASTTLALTVAPTGVLDIGTSALIARSTSDLTALRNLLLAGRLKTTATSPLYTTLSLFPNTTPQGLPYFPSYNGVQTLTPSDTIIRFTYLGDTNLDGRLTGADYKTIYESLLFQSTGWQSGDVDNSGGPVNTQDWTTFLTAYQYYQQHTQTPLGNGASDDPTSTPALQITTAAAPLSVATTSASTPSLVLTSSAGSTVTAGARLPKLTIAATNTSTSSAVGDLSSVIVRIHEGPTSGRLLGTTTVPFRRGLASFSNLSIRQAGTYSLEFVTDGYLPAITSPFTVTPAAPAKLALSASPIAPNALSPTITLALLDPFGNTVTDSSSSATLSLLTRTPGNRARFSTRTILSNGTATLDNLPLTTPGTYLLTARTQRLQSSPVLIKIP